jgi:hypothetical protein
MSDKVSPTSCGICGAPPFHGKHALQSAVGGGIEDDIASCPNTRANVLQNAAWLLAARSERLKIKTGS